MKHYSARTVSGRTVIFHGVTAMKSYLEDVERGEAEELIGDPRPGISREEHRWAHNHGLCYGKCSL